MTREERTKLIKHLKYNRSIGADYLITDEDADEIIKALEQEPTFDDECQKNIDEAWEQIQKKRKRIPVTLDLTPCDDAISRDEVLRLIENKPYDWSNLTERHNMLMKIRKLPSVTPQPCNDVISREELLKAIDTWDKFGYTETGCFVRITKEIDNYVPYVHLEDVITAIQKLPPITQKCEKCAMNGSGSKYCDNCGQKSGKWINIDDIESECSECGHREPNERFIFEDINFCAKCGAKMVEPQESEDKKCI